MHRLDTEVERRALERIDHVGEAIARDEMLLGNAEWWRVTIGDLIECDGAVVALHGTLSMSGATPLAVRDANIPYIFATGYGENLGLGPLHSPAVIVTKPFGRQELGSVIKKALGRRSAVSPQVSEPPSDT